MKIANSSPLDFFIDGSGAAGSTNGAGAPVSVAAIHSVDPGRDEVHPGQHVRRFRLQSGPTTLITASSTGVPSARWPIAGPPLSPKQVPELSAGGLSRQSWQRRRVVLVEAPGPAFAGAVVLHDHRGRAQVRRRLPVLGRGQAPAGDGDAGAAVVERRVGRAGEGQRRRAGRAREDRGSPRRRGRRQGRSPGRRGWRRRRRRSRRLACFGLATPIATLYSAGFEKTPVSTLSTQWAAVRTTRGATTVPVQAKPLRLLPASM